MALETIPENRAPEERGSSASWGAIFSGALLTFGCFAILGLLGSAIGFSIFNPGQGDTVGKGTGIGVGIYLFVTMVVSFFVGGYVASRLAGMKLRMAAALHGLTAWALVTAVFTFMLGSGISGIVSGAFNLASLGTQAAGVGQQAGIVPQEVTKTIKKQIRKGQEQLKSSSGQQQQAGQAGTEQAGQAATKIAAGSSWAGFFTLLFGALAALFGGVLGSPYRGRHREAMRPSERRAA